MEVKDTDMDLTCFIKESNSAEEIEALTNIFLKFLSSFGIDRFILGDLSYISGSGKGGHSGVLVHYPDEWLNYYVTSRNIDYNPVFQRALKTRRPFIWEEVDKNNTHEKILMVMDEDKEFSFCCGIFVPLHQPLGKLIGIGFSGSEKSVCSDKDALSLLHAASHQFYLAYLNITNNEKSDGQSVSLTDREREVLQWIARGKTKSEIAEILSLSKSSIKRHCENVFRKLEVNNLPSAVAKALIMGIINPY